MAYVKIWGDIVTSSIWGEDKETRIVWITLLAMADSCGFVPGTVPGIARAANLTNEETMKAIKVLTAPDKWSRSKEFEGRRLEEKDGGFLVINYEVYRDRKDDEHRRQYMRAYMRKKRAQEKAERTAGA